MISLQAYYAESWFTAEGARLKARRLEQAGLPDMTNWRFVTLTIADRSIGPVEAYFKGKDRMRRFLAELRAVIGPFLWAWKLEFHEDGYPHWHLPVAYRKRIPQEMLPELEAMWGLGRVHVRRINRKDLFYVFKYVAKGPEDLPEWVRQYEGRLRVFQSSKGFFSRRESRHSVRKEPLVCLVPVSLETRERWDQRKAILIEERSDGSKLMSVVKLRTPFQSLLTSRALRAFAERDSSIVPGVVRITRHGAMDLKYDQRNYSGLAAIPANAAFA